MPDRSSSPPDDHPHRDQPIETGGAPPQVADAAVVLLHGRGSTARAFSRYSDQFHHRGVLYLAPQAARSRWYPYSGYGPIERNEPWLSSALERVSATVEEATSLGIPSENVLLFGFSQGASLACEFVARHPRRYGGLVSLAGTLLGPEPSTEYDGGLDGTPVFLGCGTDDQYVSLDRLEETKAVFDRLDATVTLQLYEGLGHEINDDELRKTDELVGALR